MKILYIANGNGLNPNVGGSLMRTIEISKRLKEHGYIIRFLTTPGGFRACQNKGVKAQFHIIPSSIFKKTETSILDRIVGYVISTIASIFHIKKIPQCDIVYSDSDYFCDVIPSMLYKLRTKTKWIAMIHHLITPRRHHFKDRFSANLSAIFQKLTYQLIKRYADSIFVYDTDMGQNISNYFISLGFQKERIHYVNNGVDLRYIEKIQVNTNSKQYDGCFLGGLRPGKGIYDIVPIWIEVTKNNNVKTLIVIGGGLSHFENKFKMQIKDGNMNKKIIAIGPKSHEESLKMIKQSKVLINPSYEEGWGTAVCEALAIGIPVVAYDLPTYKIFGDSVQKVPVGNYVRFAETVNKLLVNKNLRKEKGEKGKQISKRFDWNKVAEEEIKYFITVKKI